MVFIGVTLRRMLNHEENNNDGAFDGHRATAWRRVPNWAGGKLF